MIELNVVVLLNILIGLNILVNLKLYRTKNCNQTNRNRTLQTFKKSFKLHPECINAINKLKHTLKYQ